MKERDKTCVRCGVTSPLKHIREEPWGPVCVDDAFCIKTRALGLPLPPPPPPPSEHQPGLVPPEHIETNKRALEEKEKLRRQDEVHRRKRLGLSDQDVKLSTWGDQEPVRA